MSSVPSLRDRVARFIDRHHLLPAGPVVIAFSGGPDSLCLLHLLADLAPARGWQLLAAHLDHGLRPDSATEVAAVRRLAAARDLPLLTAQVDVAALATTQRWSLEAAGRLARYRFLAELAAAYQQAPVVTGHTSDDQAETLLLHLTRGSGLPGLVGMRPLTWLPLHQWPSPATDQWPSPATGASLRLVRPLLTTPRAAILAELAARRLTPLIDLSNTDPVYTRNRLRHQLLAAWQRLDPGIAGRLARTAELLAADADYLAAETERYWPTLADTTALPISLRLTRSLLLALPLAIQRRLLRRAVASLTGASPTAAAIDTTLSLAAGPAGRRASLVGPVVAVVEPAYLCLHGPSQAPPSPPPTRPYLSPGARVALVIGGTTPLPGGHWSITTRHRPRAELDGQPWHTTAYRAYFRPTLADARPVVRTWQAGDRLLLPGLAGHKKLSDLFIDRKVPRAWRASLPLLTTASTIAWVAGLAVAEPFRATTDDVMVIECVLHADPHWPAHQ